MTAFELCSRSETVLFSIGKSKIVWESAVYKDECDKVVVSRVVESGEGGKAFLMGLRYKHRYVKPETEVIVIPQPLTP